MGIGASIAKTLAHAGANLILFARSEVYIFHFVVLFKYGIGLYYVISYK
jgi:hypothetical protein